MTIRWQGSCINTVLDCPQENEDNNNHHAIFNWLPVDEKHLLWLETIENTKLADLDASGTIDAIDFVLMKEYLLGKRMEFPADM